MTHEPDVTDVLSADTSRRPWTVQCGYVGYYANPVVVDAITPEEACDLAIELANKSDGWHCGDTFVDALAEGEDVEVWSKWESAVSVPSRFTENREPALFAALVGLLEWAATMSGWDANAWRIAERTVGRNVDADVPEPAS